MPLKKIKSHICFEFKTTPWGGGNQFLRALKEELRKSDCYTDKPEFADIILFNAHQDRNRILKLKLRLPNKLFIHRIDGPVSFYRGYDDKTDAITILINKYIADATIFQSKYSYNANKLLKYPFTNFVTIIGNTVNPQIFSKKERVEFSNKRKKRLIATSWSSAWNKGFETYHFLDENLDFNKYEMTFVGNSPIHFKNIKMVDPIPSKKVAALLKQHDIFIIASTNDPNSNSLIEALSCGLPAIALDSGGHPEIIQTGGLTFTKKKELLEKIDIMAKNYAKYQEKIKLKTIREIAKQYYDFMLSTYKKLKKGEYIPKKINLIEYILLKIKLKPLELRRIIEFKKRTKWHLLKFLYTLYYTALWGR